jgi:uncharacterized membrane protein
MTPPTATTTTRAGQDLYWALRTADTDLGVCLLSFPISTFSAALLIGLCGSLPEMHPSAAPFWIILGICALFSAWAVISVRSARRGFAKAGMPPREVRLRVARMWIATAGLMVVAGSCALGYLAMTFDPGQMKSVTLFGSVDRPLPLAITLTLYVMAGALLLGRSWREVREAKNAPKLQAVGGQETGKGVEWTREVELYSASRSGKVCSCS